MGAGVAEASGLMAALIRLLVGASPRRLLAFILIFVGVLSSVASDAGYLILVPLGAAAFLSIGRHPLAGMAACFAGVGAIFGVNPILGPIDAMITEITNEALAAAGGTPLTIVANYWFSIVSSVLLAIVAAVVTERIVEPRLGPYEPATAGGPSGISIEDEADDVHDPAAEKRGLRYALIGFLGVPRAHRVAHVPGRLGAARSRDRRHHRHDPVHGQPAVHHRDVLPDRGCRLRDRRGDLQAPQRRDRGGDEDVRRTGRPRLHAADDQPVHRLLQLQQHPERPGDRARRSADSRRHRRAAAAHRDDRRDPAARRDHAGPRAEMGDLRADLHPAVHPAGRPAADRAGRLPRRRFAAQRRDAADGLPAVHGHRSPSATRRTRASGRSSR